VILFKSAVTDDADDTGTKRPRTPPSYHVEIGSGLTDKDWHTLQLRLFCRWWTLIDLVTNWVQPIFRYSF